MNKFDLRAFAPGFFAPLIRALAVQGDYPALIEPKFSPGVQLADLSDPEYWVLRPAARRFAGAVVTAAVAAQQGFHQFGPPTGGTLVILDKIIITNDTVAAQSFSVWMGGPVAAGAQTSIFPPSDDRHNTQAKAAVISGTTAAPVLGNQMGYYRLTAGSTLPIEGPWILTGLQSLNVLHNLNNTLLAVNYFWRERPLLKSEQLT